MKEPGEVVGGGEVRARAMPDRMVGIDVMAVA